MTAGVLQTQSAETNDQVEAQVSPDRFAVGIETQPLRPNERLTVEILLDSGETETVCVSVPPTLDGDSSDELR